MDERCGVECAVNKNPKENKFLKELNLNNNSDGIEPDHNRRRKGKIKGQQSTTRHYTFNSDGNCNLKTLKLRTYEPLISERRKGTKIKLKVQNLRDQSITHLIQIRIRI